MPRNEVIEFKVTAEEKERIRSQANHLRVPVGEFVRSCALREHLGSPVPYETEHDKANKAKVRELVENEESYEVKVEPGTALPKPRSSEEELRAKAMELVRSKGLSFRAALAQVKRP